MFRGTGGTELFYRARSQAGRAPNVLCAELIGLLQPCLRLRYLLGHLPHFLGVALTLLAWNFTPVGYHLTLGK